MRGPEEEREPRPRAPWWRRELWPDPSPRALGRGPVRSLVVSLVVAAHLMGRAIFIMPPGERRTEILVGVPLLSIALALCVWGMVRLSRREEG